jgi:hypothetical protein
LQMGFEGLLLLWLHGFVCAVDGSDFA